MGVSYLSQTFKNSPYIPPVDLNLMAKVLSVKQGGFDASAAKIQGQLDTIASTDLMRGVDKDYVNSKLNNIVNNINGLGGVDLADYNVSNQISGYASSIYNDDKVISSISSTKRARALMSSYDKMKSDPKLIRYYSEANEYSDNKGLSAWMNNQEAGASYNGPSTATRYEDYNTDFQKALKDVKARKQVDMLVDGFYISKNTKESISEQDIMSMARDLLNPIQREQMQRDGVFLYEGKLKYGEKELVSKAVQSKVVELQQNKAMIENLKHNALLETNPKSKSLLNAEVKRRSDYSSALEKEIPNSAAMYSNLYRNNPNELMYKVYSDDYFRGLGNRYAQYSEDKSITTNQPALQTYLQNRMDNREIMQEKAAALINDARMKNAKELKWMELVAADKAEKDELTGEYRLKVSGTTGSPNLYDLQPNLNPSMDDVEKHFIPEAQQRVASIETEMSSQKENYLSELLSQDPNTKALLSDMSYDYNGDHKITLADFEGEKDGKLAYSLIQNPKAQRLVATALLAFENLSNGKPIAIDKFPEGTADLVEKLKFLDAERTVVNKQISDYKLLGKNTFSIPQFSDKTFSTDDKFQKSRAVNLAKAFLIKDKGISVDPSDITLLGVGKKSDGTGYKVTVQESNGKTGNKKEYTTKDYDVSNSVAGLFNIEDGPYAELNNVVTDINSDFYAPIQNEYDNKFVSNIRVFKNGNTNSYSAQYGQFNPKTNDVEYKNFPSLMMGSRTNRFSSPAQAYSFGKSIIKNFGKDLPPQSRVKLKEIFELKLNEE